MNNELKTKKYRRLSIAAFVTGIPSLTVFSLQAFRMWFSNYFTTDNAEKIFSTIFVTILGIILPIVAIICGSIDLVRIRKGFHKNKVFKAFDITGIVLGSIIFLIVTVFNLGPIIMHH